MKKNYLLGFTLIASVGFIATQKTGAVSVDKLITKSVHAVYPTGAPLAKTGAPDEQTCASCHTGNNPPQDGTTLNSLVVTQGLTPVTNYVPGASYNVALTLDNQFQDVNEGFQATVLDISTNSMAGSFPAGILGVAITNDPNTGRDYANHILASSTNSNNFWAWQWTAPATDVGPVKFYVATNIGNGNNASTGDVIYLSEHIFGSTVGLNEATSESSNFTAGYSAKLNSIEVNFTTLTSGTMFLNLVDMSGKSVYSTSLGEAKIGENSASVVLPKSIESGIYVVNFFVGNKPMSNKIMIQ